MLLQASQSISSYDARETAPSAIAKDVFLNDDGNAIPFIDAVIGGQSVGVPGTPALLQKLHEEHGKLPLDLIMVLPQQFAMQGFAVTPRLSKLIEMDKGKLDRFDVTRQYFYDDQGKALQPWQRVKNLDYLATLKRLQTGGFNSFYTDMAPEIAELVQKHGGSLVQEDFSSYQVIKREPVCAFYREHKVCSMGEPSSGGLTLLQILGMLERFDLSEGPTVENAHLIIEASRLAFADRNKYMADPDFEKTPGTNLIDKDYISSRSALISKDSRLEGVMAGDIDKENGTTHISIVDKFGNVASMTSTIEGAFGSKLMVNGFLLNNELTDFNFSLDTKNSVAPGKRPRSSMAPTIVFDPEGKPFMSLGSAGGSAIIGYVLQRIIAVIDWKMDLQSALNMPSFLARSDVVEIESRELESSISEGLEALGHKVVIKDMTSGMSAVLLSDGELIGAADPRRAGGADGK